MFGFKHKIYTNTHTCTHTHTQTYIHTKTLEIIIKEFNWFPLRTDGSFIIILSVKQQNETENKTHTHKLNNSYS